MGREDWGVEIPGGFFDEARHLYRNSKGVIVPSTTQVFSILGMNDFSGVPQETLEWKRVYGSAVHAAMEYMVVGDLDWDTVDEAIVAPVVGIEMKLQELKFECQATEESRVHSLYGMEYGLTSDLRGKIWHQAKHRNAVLDLKTALKYSPTWKWQLGAYIAAQEKVLGGWMGVIIQVDKEGETKLHYIEPESAVREFQVLLAGALLLVNNGMGKIGRG